ncbi:hypothetical protein ACTRV7_04925 [Staphylococcus xylosus]|uniref:hypothetical protein n=1 Tax=Staphylococcus xylosus TaxID=1288 RepID=UPI003F9A201D
MADREYKDAWKELKEELIRVWVKENEELNTIYESVPEEDSFDTGTKDGYQVALKHVLGVMDIKDGMYDFTILVSDMEDKQND